MYKQIRAECVETGHTHVYRQGLPFLRQRAPVDGVERVLGVGGDEAHRLRVFSMRQRNAGIGGAGQRGGDAGHDFESDAVLAQEFQFLAAATKDKRVATLQPNHPLASASVLQHQRVDSNLRRMVITRLFSDLDKFGVAAREREYFFTHQAIVQDDIGLVEQAQRAQGQQSRIAGAGANERDATATCRCRLGRQCFIERLLGRSEAGEHVIEEIATFIQTWKAHANPLALARQ